MTLVVKNPLANAGDIQDTSSIPGLGRPLEESMATHCSILAWRSPWTEEQLSTYVLPQQKENTIQHHTHFVGFLQIL